MDLHIKQKQQTKPATAKQKTGDLAEAYAIEQLKQAGLKILTTNFLCKLGEIDIIAKDKDTLVFVEVRYRKNNRYGDPLATITPAKQRKIIRCAQFFLSINPKLNRYNCRFDVVGVSPAQSDGNFDAQWITNAFIVS